ncbi:hypothetical protein [Alkalihalobacterium sp. APHAB7]|uniref:hypothetical protein n=1 Tax=Alkalihalobacterium sp. APHAB7 TaxID=3402081 RepID=UPI003AAA3161
MNEQQAIELLEQLRSGAQEKVFISKEDFMVFRAQLVLQEDRASFVGTANKGGTATYVYVQQQQEG